MHPAPPLRPLSEANSRDLNEGLGPQLRAQPGLAVADQADGRGPRRVLDQAEVDLVKGETMTALERLFAVADCANGIGTKLDIRKWTFMNTDLVVHVHRIPEGEWIGIRAETNYGPDGIGTTIGTLFDETRRGRSDPAVGAGPSDARTLMRATLTHPPVATGVGTAATGTAREDLFGGDHETGIRISTAAPKPMPSTRPFTSMSGPPESPCPTCL